MRSAAATRRWGEAFAAHLQPGDVVTLQGPLGAGKTTLAQGIARGLGVLEPVTSPTYTIINLYEGRLPLAHLDLYRLGSPEEFELVGGFDTLESSAVCLVEWAERLGERLPTPRWALRLELVPSGRRLHIDAGPREGA